MSLDRERVRDRLHVLHQTLETLEDFDVSAADLRNDRPTRWQVEHGLQLAIQTMVDIGTHILASEYQVKVDDYTEVVDRLGDLEVLEAETARMLRPLPGLRNILVHEYTDVDYELIVENLETCVGPLRDFARQIERAIDE